MTIRSAIGIIAALAAVAVTARSAQAAEAQPHSRRTRNTMPTIHEPARRNSPGVKQAKARAPRPLRGRLGALLEAAAHGRFPAFDGETELLRPTESVSAVLGFTGHHVLVADVKRAWVAAHISPGDLMTPLSPPFLAALAHHLGAQPGTLDAVWVAHAQPGPPPLELVPFTDVTHWRYQRALAFREEVQAYSTPDGAGLVLVGRGLAGRWEASMEVQPQARGRGLGSKLLRAALHLVEPGAPVFAQVAPGNVASMRATVRAGYLPFSSEILFLRDAP